MKKHLLMLAISLSMITVSNAQNTFPADGSVGIGTPNPSGKLHVLSSGSSKDETNQYSGNLIIQANTLSRSSINGASLKFAIPANTDGGNVWGQARIITVAGNNNTGDATGKLILGTRRLSPKLQQTQMAWNYGDDLVIDGAGHVGIGTLNPKEALSVNGKIRAQEVKVETQNWPDYVFQKDYELPSLIEVAQYIDKHQHLSGIPSAKEITQNGVDLGEINKVLTKKIEELTLYLIEQNKDLAAQRKDLLTQQKINQDLQSRMSHLEQHSGLQTKKK